MNLEEVGFLRLSPLVPRLVQDKKHKNVVLLKEAKMATKRKLDQFEFKLSWVYSELSVVIVGLKWCISRRSRFLTVQKRKYKVKSWEHSWLARRTEKNSIGHHNARRKRFLEVFWFISAAWNLFNTRFVLCKFKPLPCNALQNMFVHKTISSPACSMNENKKLSGMALVISNSTFSAIRVAQNQKSAAKKSPRFAKLFHSKASPPEVFNLERNKANECAITIKIKLQ